MTFELDTKALRYFIAVATHKNFTLAAAHLRITQPAVTRQIQSIEKAFGVRLFRREGRQIVLSEAGQILFEQAREIVDRLGAVQAMLKDAADEPVGKLAIGAPTSTGEMLLPAIISRYHQKYPRVFVQITTGYTGDIVEMLIDGRLDMALIFGVPTHSDLELQPLIRMDLGLIAPNRSQQMNDPIGNRSTIPLAEAAALPLIFPTRAQSLRKHVELACQQIGIEPRIILESDSLDISKALVSAGMGYMFLNASGIRREIKEGKLRYLSVTEPLMEWQLSLATRRTKSHTLATRMMMREIVETVRKEAVQSGWNWKLA